VANKQPNAFDVHIGKRIRTARILIGMSQERLGSLLGVTFQQIQKYERGFNRIGAGRLYDVAAFLNVPISFFYQDLEHTALEQPRPAAEPSAVKRFLASGEGLELALAFQRIKDAKVRRRMLHLMRSLAAEPDGDNGTTKSDEPS
jgi:transcriptional regulator with XRE-family HTH domain